MLFLNCLNHTQHSNLWSFEDAHRQCQYLGPDTSLGTTVWPSEPSVWHKERQTQKIRIQLGLALIKQGAMSLESLAHLNPPWESWKTSPRKEDWTEILRDKQVFAGTITPCRKKSRHETACSIPVFKPKGILSLGGYLARSWKQFRISRGVGAMGI